MTLLTNLRMLRWKLREVMARQRMSNRDLSKLINSHEVSVSQLKNRETMPRIDGEKLEALCRALKCTPMDLLEYVPDEEI